MGIAGNFKKQRGFSPLIVLVILGATILTVTQINLFKTSSGTKKEQAAPQKIADTTTQTNTKTQPENLKKYLIAEAALLGVADDISLYFQDLQNDSLEVSLEPTKSWIPASTIKAYVLLEAFRQNRLGLIDFDQTVTISADNVVSTELETDDFPRLREGTQATIRQLAETMIIQSDNTAYNTLLDILDRRNINNSLKNIGITETVVGEKLNLDGDQFQKDLTIPGRQPNTTTVKDLATYFSLLYSHKIPDSEQILSVFRRQKINNMIPARLPEDTVVAHKTGEWAPIYHDGGIVYKPKKPFVFVTFTNSGDPAIVAKLAQVAFYQDPKYVGKNLALAPTKQNLALANRPIYYSNSKAQVLGESTDKFPTITAEDLGITSKDLIPDIMQINNVHSALITPGSLLYYLKKAFEDSQLKLSIGNTAKAQTYLRLANNRLDEIKALLSKGNVEKTSPLLTEAVENIKNATNLAKDDPEKDKLLIQIKKTYDLYYAVMADRADSLPDEKKASFVDTVYNFYQKGKAEISPIINSSVIVNPTQQKPTIGVIEKVSSDKLTLKFDDGSTKEVNISSATNVRAADQEVNQKLNTLKKGNKVAVLGPNGSDTIIDAQFILNDIPKGLIDQHQGTVTGVDPNKGVIKLIDQRGQVNLVQIEDKITIKSTNTDVSIEGIKIGSKVVIFGIPQQANSLANTKAAPIPSSSASTKPGSPLPKQGGSNNTPVNNNAPAANTQSQDKSEEVIQIKATSVTVTVNSSGKDEGKVSPSSSNNHPSAPQSQQQTNQPQPASPSKQTPANQNPPAEKKEDKKDKK